MNKQQLVPMEQYRAYTQSFSQPGLPAQMDTFGGAPYPGLGGNPSSSSFSQSLVPFNSSSGINVPSSAGSALGGLNLGQFKDMFNRMGGIDGIVGTMGKVQKVITSFQQMSPLVKLMLGSFVAAKAKDVSGDLDGLAPIRRKKRNRRRKPVAGRNKPYSRSAPSRARRNTVRRGRR